MKSRFIHFTSESKYIDNAKCWCSADRLLEAWLNEHPNVYVQSWQAGIRHVYYTGNNSLIYEQFE